MSAELRASAREELVLVMFLVESVDALLPSVSFSHHVIELRSASLAACICINWVTSGPVLVVLTVELASPTFCLYLAL